MLAKKKKFSLIPTEEKVLKLCNWLEESKAIDTYAFDIKELSSVTDAVIISSANSVRHAQSLAENIASFCKAENLEFMRMEGQTTGQWILVDLNDVVIHIFQKEVRGLYDLEGLWPQTKIFFDSRKEENNA